jgi:tetratricopeptide (TPR) repeat protein
MDQQNNLVQGILPIPQRDVALLLEAGYLYMEMNRAKEAEEVFTGVAALVPHSEVPHLALGHLYFSQNRYSPAYKAQQEALRLSPDCAAAFAAAAESLFFLRRPQEALESLERALKLEPTGPAGAFAKNLKEAHALGIFG